MRTLPLTFCLFISLPFLFVTANLPLLPQEVLAQETGEKEIFIHIHSGVTTWPVRKVISIIIKQAEEKGVQEIVGSGKHVEWDVWDITFSLLKGAESKELKWRYGRQSGNLQAMNDEAMAYSFPGDKYIISPAINKGLGMIEEKGVKPEDILGRGEKLQDGQWQLSLNVIDIQGDTYAQRWMYNPKSGGLIPQHFDHSALDKVLANCLTAKGVNYTVLKKNPDLQEFFKTVSYVYKEDLEALPREEQIAFWIDVYNATVLKRVGEKYPIKGVKEIKGFFDKDKLKVAGKAFTLNDLQNYLLDDLKEPKALFALVSGTKSSPPLRKEAYCGRYLEKQLNDDTKTFLNSPANLYVTEAGILLSPILEPLAKRGLLRAFLNSLSDLLPSGVS
ncbi:MAG TPA: DUF547 domain-containing protein, partial [Candidatus Hypogeohydataceae bacterium YC40]